jgi:hypothetical protein
MIEEGTASTVTAAGTTVLTVSSVPYQQFTGSTTQTVQLPNATTLHTGHYFEISNKSTDDITIVDNGLNVLTTLPTGSGAKLMLMNAGTSNGTWDLFFSSGSTAANPVFTGTLSASSANFSGNISALNFSGTLAGTNSGDTTLAAVGSSPNANAASLTGQVLNLQPFDSTHPGVVAASGGGTTNFLRADGTWTGAPTPAAKFCYSGYHSGLSSGWQSTGLGYQDSTAGSGHTLTQTQNNGMGTVNTAGSSLPGLSLTFPTSGLYFIQASVEVAGPDTSLGGVRLVGSAGLIDNGASFYNVTGTSGNARQVMLHGLYNSPVGADTIKLQLDGPFATVGIAAKTVLVTLGSPQISWTIIQM